MLAKARMAAGEKGYENGIRATSAKARTAAGEKGYENGNGSRWKGIWKWDRGYVGRGKDSSRWKGYENGIAKGLESKADSKNESWEEQYAEFDDYDEMPKSNSTLYTWQKNQLSGFDGKIKMEIAVNEGSTMER
jgi:hypothetical protein